MARTCTKHATASASASRRRQRTDDRNQEDILLKKLTRTEEVVDNLSCLLGMVTTNQYNNDDGSSTSTRKRSIELLETIRDSAKAALSLLPSPKLNKNKGDGRKLGEIVCEGMVTNPYDHYVWRKYGDKRIKNSEFRREYYRCSYCGATKTVQQISPNPNASFWVTYKKQHSCIPAVVITEPAEIVGTRPLKVQQEMILEESVRSIAKKQQHEIEIEHINDHLLSTDGCFSLLNLPITSDDEWYQELYEDNPLNI